MKKILALDDDPVILALIKTVMAKTDYTVQTHTSGIDAIHDIRTNSYDLIISDLSMPQMSGDEFYREVRDLHKNKPFIFLTANDDVETGIRIMKMGADDYMRKPIKGEELISRITKAIEEKEKEILIRNTLMEDLLDEREHRGFFSWKDLYGAKESDQANQIMSFLSRNIEQGGGFKWLSMLKKLVEQQDSASETLTIDRSMINLIIESTDYISNILSDLNYVTSLLDEEFPLEDMDLRDFIDLILDLFNSELIPVIAQHKKRISLNIPKFDEEYNLALHRESILKIIRELIYNAIKYSSENSKILIQLNIVENRGGDILELSFWNNPLNAGLKNDQGDPIIGIPYEYSESVFELFYTMDRFPIRIPEEEWSQGTGLFIVRKMLQKMNGNISARNIIMKTLQESVPYVRQTISIPLGESIEEVESL